MQYLLLIHENAKTPPPSDQEWATFFERAKASGLFKGGSALGRKELVGAARAAGTTEHIAGFMRFDAEDRTQLLELLREHPVVKHGGTVELCEMPKTPGDGGRSDKR